jgi:hypothetical protein
LREVETRADIETNEEEIGREGKARSKKKKQ